MEVIVGLLVGMVVGFLVAAIDKGKVKGGAFATIIFGALFGALPGFLIAVGIATAGIPILEIVWAFNTLVLGFFTALIGTIIYRVSFRTETSVDTTGTPKSGLADFLEKVNPFSELPGDYYKEKVNGENGQQFAKPQLEVEIAGKYATKNILDESDNFIIKRGDLITRQLVERAKNEGFLDQLRKYSEMSPPKEDEENDKNT